MPAVVDLAAMRDGIVRLGGDPQKVNPLVPVDLVIDHSVMVDVFGTDGRAAEERRHRVRAQRRALRLPALGPGGVRQFPRGAARHRHLPPGEPGIPGADRVDRRGRRQDLRLSRHPVRHRQPHHHGQRPGRAGLGRRRHRGRGGHARPADRHADPRRDRLPPDRPAARGRHRHRPGADRHPDAARARAWSASSSSSSAPASTSWRSPTAPPSPTWRPNTAPPAASSRSMR